jgi:hypothetical protein
MKYGMPSGRSSWGIRLAGGYTGVKFKRDENYHHLSDTQRHGTEWDHLEVSIGRKHRAKGLIWGLLQHYEVWEIRGNHQKSLKGTRWKDQDWWSDSSYNSTCLATIRPWVQTPMTPKKKKKKKSWRKLGECIILDSREECVLVHTCNPATQEAETGGFQV